MTEPLSNEGDQSITGKLREWNDGDPASLGLLMTSLYWELHRMAAHAFSSERSGHTLQPTALISELYLRLQASNPPEWHGRAHFFAVAATTMRRILIDHARAHGAKRRGGDATKLPLEFVNAGTECSYDQLLQIDEALTKLSLADQRAARVAELRFFGGLQETEIAEELGVSVVTVKRDWKFARAWLVLYLNP
jgi:RNA polymerase sigma factor (TIGR02999 family)